MYGNRRGEGEGQSNGLYVHNLIAMARRRVVMVSNYWLELCFDQSGHNDHSLCHLLYHERLHFSRAVY